MMRFRRAPAWRRSRVAGGNRQAPRPLISDSQSFGDIMDKDKSILEKITGTMKDTATSAGVPAINAMKAKEPPPKAEERPAASTPLAADGRFRSKDGPADCGCSRSAKEARRLEAGGKGRQQDSSKEGRREIRGEAPEEKRSREAKEPRQNGPAEN